ncbi:MAG: ATP-binding protein [Chromatiales bacterium]|nr:ATP-binding protein [Chromatiales bacterium]
MRLAPKTLFGRMMLILVLGLIITQIFSASLLLKDRREAFQERFGLQLIQRIASVVSLIEEMGPDKRQQMLMALSTPTFKVSISDQALDSDHSPPSNYLEVMLEEALPNHNEVCVHFDKAPFPKHFGREHRSNRHSPPLEQARRDDRRDDSPRWRRPPKMIMTVVQVQLSDGQWLRFHRPMPKDNIKWPFKVMGYLAVLLIGISLAALLAVRLVTKPLTTLSKAAESLGKNIDHPPLTESGPQEVERAAKAFNTMQGRLQRYIDDRNQVLAAVSHDLKTPITRLRLRTELIDDQQLSDKIEKDLAEMEQMVSASLDYLRGTDSKEKSVTVDIFALLEGVRDDMQDMDWEVALSSAKIPPIQGRPLGLKRLFTNLIENAVRYGERADIHFEDTAELLTVIIADAGPTPTDLNLEQLFQPFFRTEQSRNKATGGTGLGLGIARNIARSHGGDVILQPGKEQGIEAVVTQPR